MSSTTYTLLVTIAHEDGAAISTDLLEVMVQRGLEEGVREMAGVDAAQVSAISGDRIAPGVTTAADYGALLSARKLHAALRA